jgi:hypothetical protein
MAGLWKALENAPPVVGQVTGHPALKRGEPWHSFASVRCQQPANDDERVGGNDPLGTVRKIEALSSRAFAPHDREWIRSQEGIAAERRPPDGAVEEDSVGQPGKQLAATDRIGG